MVDRKMAFKTSQQLCAEGVEENPGPQNKGNRGSRNRRTFASASTSTAEPNMQKAIRKASSVPVTQVAEVKRQDPGSLTPGAACRMKLSRGIHDMSCRSEHCPVLEAKKCSIRDDHPGFPCTFLTYRDNGEEIPICRLNKLKGKAAEDMDMFMPSATTATPASSPRSVLSSTPVVPVFVPSQMPLAIPDLDQEVPIPVAEPPVAPEYAPRTLQEVLMDRVRMQMRMMGIVDPTTSARKFMAGSVDDGVKTMLAGYLRPTPVDTPLEMSTAITFADEEDAKRARVFANVLKDVQSRVVHQHLRHVNPTIKSTIVIPPATACPGGNTKNHVCAFGTDDCLKVPTARIHSSIGAGLDCETSSSTMAWIATSFLNALPRWMREETYTEIKRVIRPPAIDVRPSFFGTAQLVRTCVGPIPTELSTIKGKTLFTAGTGSVTPLVTTPNDPISYEEGKRTTTRRIRPALIGLASSGFGLFCTGLTLAITGSTTIAPAVGTAAFQATRMLLGLMKDVEVIPFIPCWVATLISTNTSPLTIKANGLSHINRLPGLNVDTRKYAPYAHGSVKIAASKLEEGLFRQVPTQRWGSL